jgi:hypothetical protein
MIFNHNIKSNSTQQYKRKLCHSMNASNKHISPKLIQ